MEEMKFRNSILLAAVFAFVALVTLPAGAQTEKQQPASKPAVSTEAGTKEKNTDAYIALLHRDVRQEKAEIMGATLVLSAQDELAKLNDQRIANHQGIRTELWKSVRRRG
jgi:hypothetical protein